MFANENSSWQAFYALSTNQTQFQPSITCYKSLLSLSLPLKWAEAYNNINNRQIQSHKNKKLDDQQVTIPVHVSHL